MGLNPDGGLITELKVAIQPNIGLDESTRRSIVELLNQMLSDEMVLATKTRSAYWNIQGAGFFELHTLFDAQYHEVCDLTEKIAERTRMMGGFACGSLQGYLEHTRLTEQPGDVPGLMHLLADHEAVIRYIREDSKKCLEEFEDQGTADLLTGAIRLHEKMAWMLRSYVEIVKNRL